MRKKPLFARNPRLVTRATTTTKIGPKPGNRKGGAESQKRNEKNAKLNQKKSIQNVRAVHMERDTMDTTVFRAKV